MNFKFITCIDPGNGEPECPVGLTLRWTNATQELPTHVPKRLRSCLAKRFFRRDKRALSTTHSPNSWVSRKLQSGTSTLT